MEVLDRLLEAVSLDEPHGVVGPAVGVGSHAIDRHDARMLQSAGDLGLGEEPLAADRVVGMGFEDLLERHLAVQLVIQRHEHLAQPAAGMRSEHPEPQAVAGGDSDGIAGGAVGVDVSLVRIRLSAGADLSERAVDVGIAQSSKFSRVERAAGGGQAPLDIAVFRRAGPPSPRRRRGGRH